MPRKNSASSDALKPRELALRPQVIFLMPPRFIQGHPLPPVDGADLHIPKLLIEIKQLFPDIQPDDQVDAEKFWEVHLELLALLQQKALVWVIAGDTTQLQPLGDAPKAPDLSQPIVRLGRLPFGVNHAFEGQSYNNPLQNAQQTWPPELEIKAAEDYMNNAVFRANAGRITVMAGIESETGGFDRWFGQPNEMNKSLAQTLLDFRQQGIKEVFLKCHIQKYLTAPLDIEGLSTLSQAKAKVDETLDYAIVHLAGLGDAFSVQEKVAMEKEYRIVVVGGQIISGAGAIPSFTPLDRTTKGTFDPKVQRSFTSREITVLSNAELEVYEQFASRVVSELAADKTSPLHTYILDICQINNTPAIVEINPFVNFGVYANDVDKVMRSILSQAQLIQVAATEAKSDLDHAEITF